MNNSLPSERMRVAEPDLETLLTEYEYASVIKRRVASVRRDRLLSQGCPYVKLAPSCAIDRKMSLLISSVTFVTCRLAKFKTEAANEFTHDSIVWWAANGGRLQSIARLVDHTGTCERCVIVPLGPPGRGNLLYFVPGTSTTLLSDTSVPIAITEGAKKTIALYRLSW